MDSKNATPAMPTNTEETEAPGTRSRVPRACYQCSKMKKACDNNLPCRRCRLRKEICRYEARRGRAGSISSAVDTRHRVLAPCAETATTLGVQPEEDTWDGAVYGHRPYPSPLHSSAYSEQGLIVSPTMYPQSGTRRDNSEFYGLAPMHSAQTPPQPLPPPLEVQVRQPPAEQTNLPTPFTFFADTAGWACLTPSVSTQGPTSSLLDPWLGNPANVRLPVYTPCRTSGPSEDNRGTGSWTCQTEYTELNALLPHLQGALSAEDAVELLNMYFHGHESPRGRPMSPYFITDILHPTRFHSASPQLLLAVLFCSAQTAGLEVLTPPGARQRITLHLYGLVLDHVEPLDADNAFQVTGRIPGAEFGSTDKLLALVILTIVLSSGRFKTDSLKWWAKTVRLTYNSGLTMEDQPGNAQSDDGQGHLLLDEQSIRVHMIVKEERRRLFWLIYCVDRHHALFFNTTLHFPEGSFWVDAPLADTLWRRLPTLDPRCIPTLSLDSPSSKITGFSFFESFLPLSTILGHIVDLHHIRSHPTLCMVSAAKAIDKIDALLTECEDGLRELRTQLEGSMVANSPAASSSSVDHFYYTLQYKHTVLAYATHMIHVLYILLHGPWDPVSMLDAASNADEESDEEEEEDSDQDDDDVEDIESEANLTNKRTWTLPGTSFRSCTAHALGGVTAVEQILALDPHLSFRPYLFGILLFHGSAPLLAIIERMAGQGVLSLLQHGSLSSPSARHVCESVVRAHEICLRTLDTAFQRDMRTVFRALLRDLERGDPSCHTARKAQAREILSLYRWTRGSTGLAC